VYKALVRRLVRHQIDQLNQGNYEPILKMAAADGELAFPGDNSWSSQFRPPQPSRQQWTTHRGRAEMQAFADRFVAIGLHLDIEDILVNGPPWHTRVAVRATDWQVATDGTGGDRYANRAVAFLELRWGRLIRWEDYEDTERVSAWDALDNSDDRIRLSAPAGAAAGT